MTGEGTGISRIVEPGQIDVSHGPILYLENVTVAFDGLKALDDLTLYVDDGELRCIIGPNGAGKTTLMDVITGKTRPDTGTVFFGNTVDLTAMREHEIARAGVGQRADHAGFDRRGFSPRTSVHQRDSSGEDC